MESGIDGVSDSFPREVGKAKRCLVDFSQTVSRLESRITALSRDSTDRELAQVMDDGSHRLDAAEVAFAETLNGLNDLMKSEPRFYQRYLYWEDIQALERVRTHTRKCRDDVEARYRSLCEGKAEQERCDVSVDGPLHSKFR